MTPRQKVIGGGFALAAVFVAALNLRAGISSVGPVLGDLLAWYDASGALAGLVTAMPGMFFAVMGLAAVPIASRLGLSRTLLLGMTMTLAGLALRLVRLLVAGALRPDHPFIAWATDVSLATLSAFVVLAVLVPGGLLATVPLGARLAGVAAGALGYAALGRRLLPALAAGLAGLGLAWGLMG